MKKKKKEPTKKTKPKKKPSTRKISPKKLSNIIKTHTLSLRRASYLTHSCIETVVSPRKFPVQFYLKKLIELHKHICMSELIHV